MISRFLGSIPRFVLLLHNSEHISSSYIFQDKDTNQNFVRIQRFGPKFENCRTNVQCWRRITLVGHDSSKTSFAIQNPASRHARREERLMQILRTFNGYFIFLGLILQRQLTILTAT
jgi:phosphatidylinositol kinase/protein kinase (PI-3  family)